jgi:hypothetical protein
MTPLQEELARTLRRAAAKRNGQRIVYRTEYLGYLPFGQYHSVRVAGEDVSLACPDGWEWRDLEALADAGIMTRVSQWDDCEQEWQYDVAAGGAEPGATPGPRGM